MRLMNDYDLHSARQRFGQGRTPNRLALVLCVDNLREWADRNSDRWAYWPKPVRAAAKAIELIDSCANPEYARMQREDITNAEMKAAVRPIKAFLTRQGASTTDREIILRAVEVVA